MTDHRCSLCGDYYCTCHKHVNMREETASKPSSVTPIDLTTTPLKQEPSDFEAFLAQELKELTAILQGTSALSSYDAGMISEGTARMMATSVQNYYLSKGSTKT